MIRATTPTQQFNIHTNDVKELLITYKQNDIVLQKTLEDVVLEEGIASFVLSQEEANLFDKGLVKVDVRLLTEGNVAFASQTFTTSVRDVLDPQILGDGTKPETNPCACVFDCHFDGCDCFDVEYEELIKGDKGEDGVGIESVVMNADYTLTINLTDGTSYTTLPLKGADGKDGRGIASTVLNTDYTLTITFTDGTSYTTPSIRGEKGADGYTPIKGIDYFTPSEVQNIEDEVKAELDKEGYIKEETDPTVPSHVKSITEEDINRWNEGGSGTTDYNELLNKPTLNGTELVGDVTLPIPTKTSELENDSNFARIDDTSQTVNETWSSDKLARKFSEIEMMKEPNVTIVGNPTIQNGQISDFTSTDYCQFPFIVDFKEMPFVIDLEMTTGNEVQYQHNILDSAFGLAFAVRQSRFVIAISTNGTSWDIGEGIGTHVIQPNSTYRVRMAWDLANFVLSYSTDGGQTYIVDITKPLTIRPFPKQMFIGVTSDKSTVFNGSVNLNYCSLYVNGLLRWIGMGVMGAGEKADITLANINEMGEQKIRDLAPKVKINGVETTDNNIPYASLGTYGLQRVYQDGGLTVNTQGNLTLYNATNSAIDNRGQYNYQAVQLFNLDYAVKQAMCDGKGAEWTEEEKANARERMGASARLKKIELVLTESVNAWSITIPEEAEEVFWLSHTLHDSSGDDKEGGRQTSVVYAIDTSSTNFEAGNRVYRGYQAKTVDQVLFSMHLAKVNGKWKHIGAIGFGTAQGSGNLLNNELQSATAYNGARLFETNTLILRFDGYAFDVGSKITLMYR